MLQRYEMGIGYFPKQNLPSKGDVISKGIACLLMFAAGMKAWQLATTVSLGEGLLRARWFNVVVIEFELAFTTLLIFSGWHKLTRYGTIITFSVFACVSLFEAFSGVSNCGCFGVMQVNPWLTSILDIVIIGLAIWSRKVNSNDRIFSVGKMGLGVLAWALVSALILGGISSGETKELSTLGAELVGADGRRTIVLEPEKWKNDELPLLPYIEPLEVREQLKTGEWTIVLYRRGCSKCHETIADLALKGTSRVVCVEAPSIDNGGDGEIPFGFVCAKLSANLDWFVETPTVISIANNAIVK